MTPPAVIALIAPLILLAIAAGCFMWRRALTRTELLPEEMALAGAWVFVVGSLVWLGAYLGEFTLLGFGVPWTWLAGAHFFFAGFGALTVTALTCRLVSNLRSLRILRTLLVMHPVVYLVTAAGIMGIRYCDEMGAAGYAGIFVIQLGAVGFGGPYRVARVPRFLILLALMVPLLTMIPALSWAWRVPIFDIAGMVRYHGLVNALGHVGLGLAAFAWGRPLSHAAFLNKALLAP